MTQQEFRVFGPPGTGKTTYLSSQIENAVQKFGSESVIVSSFTRAAAAELISRDLPINKQQIGTLHAHCYRILSNPDVAESHIKEWNEEYPHYELKNVGDRQPEEPAFSGGDGSDNLYVAMNVYRAKMVDQKVWPMTVQYFHKAWCDWKQSMGYLDFTDLIEEALYTYTDVPGGASIGFFDEVQDFTPLELALVRHWSKNMDYVVLAGDDDQCIYNFKGSDPFTFLTPELDAQYKRVLAQSYRVPRAIHEYTAKWISSVRREPKEYSPRDVEGEVRRIPGGFQSPDMIALDMQRYLEQGKSVMVIGACSYMLYPIVRYFREVGTPFHNPFRRKRGDWNPLHVGRGTSAVERLRSYLKPIAMENTFWSARDVKIWAEMLKKKGVFVKGGDDVLKKLKPDQEIDAEVLLSIFEPNAMNYIWDCDTQWLRDHLLARWKKSLQFPLQVYDKHGAKTLYEEPKIITGTIHSVKGGEADVVYLFPDTSMAGMQEIMGSREGGEAAKRQFYVGMTRARESLVLCRANGSYTMPGLI